MVLSLRSRTIKSDEDQAGQRTPKSKGAKSSKETPKPSKTPKSSGKTPKPSKTPKSSGKTPKPSKTPKSSKTLEVKKSKRSSSKKANPKSSLKQKESSSHIESVAQGKSIKFSDDDDDDDNVIAPRKSLDLDKGRRKAKEAETQKDNQSDSEDDDAPPTAVSFTAARETIDIELSQQQDAISSLTEKREQRRKDAFERQEQARERKRKRLSKDTLEQAKRDLKEAKRQEEEEREERELQHAQDLFKGQHVQFGEESEDEEGKPLNVDGFELMNVNRSLARMPDKSALDFRRQHLYGSRVNRVVGNVVRKKKKFGMAKSFAVNDKRRKSGTQLGQSQKKKRKRRNKAT